MPTSPTDPPEVRCSACGHHTTTSQLYCPNCGRMLSATVLLERQPRMMPATNQGIHRFGPKNQVILQLLPSGACITMSLLMPAVLGRIQPLGEVEFVDLSPYHADQHGVSRQHCRLERRYDQLVVVDLGSLNGTHLNNTRLPAHEEYILAHGDKLILGTLNILISFA